MNEIDNMKKFCVFKIIPLSSVPSGTKIFSIVTGCLTKRMQARTPEHEEVDKRKSVKKITFQNLWPRINSNQLLIKTARSTVLLFAASAAKFENVTLVAHWRKHFRVLGNNFGCSTPSKKRCLST